MRKHNNIMLIAGTVLALAAPIQAQEAAPTAAPVSTTRGGPVDLTWQKGSSEKGNQVRVTGNVHLSSDTFAANAETITVDLLRGAQGKTGGGRGGTIDGVGRAAMEPLPGRQVSGQYSDIAQGRKYQFQADHAVYVPDNARPGGGRIDLTGHVRVAVNAPIALDGPLVTVTDHAVVLLGQGAQYPQVQTGAGHLTFTPLNGGQ